MEFGCVGCPLGCFLTHSTRQVITTLQPATDFIGFQLRHLRLQLLVSVRMIRLSIIFQNSLGHPLPFGIEVCTRRFSPSHDDDRICSSLPPTGSVSFISRLCVAPTAGSRAKLGHFQRQFRSASFMQLENPCDGSSSHPAALAGPVNSTNRDYAYKVTSLLLAPLWLDTSCL